MLLSSNSEVRAPMVVIRGALLASVLALGALGLLLAEELRKMIRRRWRPVGSGDHRRLPHHERHDPRAFA